MLVCVSSVSAQNQWGITGGVSVSTTSTKNFGWRMGGYLGGLYDIQVGNGWSVQPQLLASYEETESKKSNAVNAYWSRFALTLPVLANYKINLSDGLTLNLQAGPYLQYAIFGRNRVSTVEASGNTGSAKGWWQAKFGNHFMYGVQAGANVQFNRAFVSLGYRYALNKNFLNADGHGQGFSLGVGYLF